MSSVSLRGPLAPARFVERPNRFLVRCRLEDSGVVEAHLPDPGRLEELLVPEARMRLRPASSPTRKTDWTAVLVESPGGGGWVSVDTTLPNRLVERTLRREGLPELAGWSLHAAEVTLGASRFDFVLERGPAAEQGGSLARESAGGPARLVLEVKSVTLVEDGLGLFPDAVTARGTRHVTELGELAASGERECAVLFLVQRDDARAVMAAPSIDPDFASALADARDRGVRVLARRCRVDAGGERVELGEPIPVRWPRSREG